MAAGGACWLPVTLGSEWEWPMAGRGCGQDTGGGEGTLTWGWGESGSGCEGEQEGEEAGSDLGAWWESGRGKVPMPLSRVLV